MQQTCSHCQAAWDFDRRPSFCPFCGKSLPPETARQPPPAVSGSEAATVAAAPHPAAGNDGDPEVVGGYQLLRVLGVGGMGKVYEAQHAATGRRVALKLVSAEYAASAETLERFRQEGQLASRIAHPRCVFVLAADEDAGRPYIVMELMPGDNLDDFVRRNGPQPPVKAVAMILDVVEGLQEAHRVGVVHRDVKPSNCFIGHDGRLKVGDFGLSKSLAQEAHLTKTGSFLGTPLYASPEQVRGETLDAQTDVYSTAATLYFLLTGKAPFQSDNAAVTLARIAADPAPSMRTLKPELPPGLDAVVLRGLERDRKLRWHDLEAFAEALRPFLPGRASLVGLGMRFGALALDYGIKWLINVPLSMVLLTVGWIDISGDAQHVAYYGPLQLFSLSFSLLYFGLPEGLWGWSLAKYLLGLRVRNVATGAAPGLWRGLLRAFLFYILLNLGTSAMWLIVLPLLDLPPQPTPAELMANFAGYMVVSFTPLVGMVVGVALMLCTMRKSNGYRALYEFLSGTCVVLLPRRDPKLLAAAPPGQTLSQTPGLPEKVGPFAIRGAFRSDERARVLLGADPALGRQVVLWLRPADEPPLDAERREVNRTTRLRWLVAGQMEGWQWDAFVAPGGCSLAALVAAAGALPWPRFQPLLKQLTDELLNALKENTLPDHLGPELVWVRADGAVVLLDTRFTDVPAATGDVPFDDIPEKQAVALLARTAVLGLEGTAVRDLPDAVRAPLPLSAAAALRKMLDFESTNFRLRDAKEHLAALQDKPVEVTRARRAGQLAVMGVFLFLSFGCCLSPFGSLLRFSTEMAFVNMQALIEEDAIDNLDRASLSDYLAARTTTNPLAGVAAVPTLEADAERRRVLEEDMARSKRKMADRVRWGGYYHQLVAKQSKDQSMKQRVTIKSMRPPAITTAATLRLNAAVDVNALRQRMPTEAISEGVDYASFLLGPVLWVLWAFLTVGGVSYHLLRIAVVCRDGRPAGRFRCAWRALLVWIPAGLLLVLSFRLDEWYWSQWGTDAAPVWALWTSAGLWYGTWLLLLAYVLVALRYPRRSLHDYLAGTCLVPR